LAVRGSDSRSRGTHTGLTNYARRAGRGAPLPQYPRVRRQIHAEDTRRPSGPPNGPLELVERDLPEPGRGEVRVKVQACGICHSDSFVKEGTFPGITYPRVPGHEIAGVIDALGPDVIGWRVGQRVGVGWFGGHCGRCEPCRRGRLIDCRNLRIPGITYDGGYAEAMVTPAESLAVIPDNLVATDAAPLLCAGVTTYNALRQSGAMAGDVVAILGIGGLGHLGVQFAARMGFYTVAIARGRDKENLARSLGAHVYVDSKSEDVVAALNKLRGACVAVDRDQFAHHQRRDRRHRRRRQAGRRRRFDGGDPGFTAAIDLREPWHSGPRLGCLDR
jgi:D-arabinose 1-dehydrogenase-like Zn-dependent alcohol dehydrogenase